jgi:hypothetical protein
MDHRQKIKAFLRTPRKGMEGLRYVQYPPVPKQGSTGMQYVSQYGACASHSRHHLLAGHAAGGRRQSVSSNQPQKSQCVCGRISRFTSDGIRFSECIKMGEEKDFVFARGRDRRNTYVYVAKPARKHSVVVDGQRPKRSIVGLSS